MSAHGDAAPDEHAASLLGESGLAGAADQLPAGLSSGQRRRLALATCFARPRLLVLLDEPEQRLDSGGRRWLTGRLLAEKQAGHGVLFASHDRSLVNAGDECGAIGCCCGGCAQAHGPAAPGAAC